MALKAYRTNTFKANIKFLDDNSLKEVTCRLPRPIDYHLSSNGNQLENLLYTYANMTSRFEKPVQVPMEDGSLLNIFTLRELVDYGVAMDTTDIEEKWMEHSKKAQEETEEAVKKSKSGGGSDKKDIVEESN